MRRGRVARVMAIGFFFPASILAQGRYPRADPPPKAESLPRSFLEAGKKSGLELPPLDPVYANTTTKHRTNVVLDRRISEVKLEPSDEWLKVRLARGEKGQKMVFEASRGSEGREYTATVTCEYTIQPASRPGVPRNRNETVAETRTVTFPIAILLPKVLPDIVLTPGTSHKLPLPGKITVLKTKIGNESVASINETHSRMLVITGIKAGETRLKLQYSLHGEERTAEAKIDLVARGLDVPLAAGVGAVKSLAPADVEKLSGLKGSFLSLVHAGDPKLCKVGLEGGAIRVTGLNAGVTSATVVYGVKDKERIRVEIEIEVENTRSD